MAEVVVTMANDDGSAPPQFSGHETLEISRRIERDEGSAYRINGKDVRARDVQLLFADASPVRALRLSSARGRSATSSMPSRRRAASSSKQRPASPACIHAGMKPN